MIDLESVALQLRLDLLAVDVSSALRSRDVPHALIKGPTTAHWLYDPPRRYRDVDVLVPISRRQDAVRALVAAGVVTAVHGRWGEEASHSLVLLAPTGAEVDLHDSLPAMEAPRGDALWHKLSGHLSDFSLGGWPVPALAAPARCLVLAMHVLASGVLHEQVREDLRRARDRATPQEWTAMLRLADDLGVRPHVDAAVALVDGTSPHPELPAIALRLGGASGSAIQLERLLRERKPALLAALVREAVPSPAFIRRAYPGLAPGWSSLLEGYARRFRRLCAELPDAVAQVRAARRRRVDTSGATRQRVAPEVSTRS